MTFLYDITLSVPLGIRYGTMLIHQDSTRITGEMSILGNKSSFSGSQSGNEFFITGTLKTLLREISYQGNGTFLNGQLNLLLHSSHSVYKLTGKLHKDSDSNSST